LLAAGEHDVHGFRPAVGCGRDDPYEIDDELAQRIFDARAAYKARIGAGMHRFRVVTEPPGDVADGEQRDTRTDAYLAMKKRLHTAGPVRRAPKPVDPGWQKL
jgi:hypothetical protein